MEIVLQVVMIGFAFAAGYGVRAIHKPTPKRGKNGRFTKS